MNERFNDGRCRLLIGDCRASLRSLEPNSVHCCVTSPPYWGLRDYGCDGQIGLEETPDKFVEEMVEVFREVRRVLRDDGTLWLNLGDSYAGSNCGGGFGSETITGRSVGQDQSRIAKKSIPPGRPNGLKPKDMVGIPWRVAFALQADGWWLRQDIIWSKPSPMPESVRDRCTKSHEYLFLLSKSDRYFFDSEAIKEPVTGNSKPRGSGVNAKIKHPAGWAKGSEPHDALSHNQGPRSKQNESFSASVTGLVETRNKRSVWTIPSVGYSGAHFATYPPKLVEPCVLAGTSDGGCCGTCGAPKVRNVEAIRESTRPGTGSKVIGRESLEVGNRDPQRHVTRTVTVGWESSCDCDSETLPCVVLDPFGGSGTTAQVAIENNRRAILCELNPEYAELAVRRVTETHPALF